MYILPDFQENTRHTGVLADGHVFRIGDFIVFNNFIQHALCNLAVLAGAAVFDRTFYIGRKVLVRFDTEPLHHICNLTCIYFTHMNAPFPFLLYSTADS